MHPLTTQLFTSAAHNPPLFTVIYLSTTVLIAPKGHDKREARAMSKCGQFELFLVLKLLFIKAETHSLAGARSYIFWF